MSIAVKCSGVKKIFGKGANSFEALRGIDLSIDSNEWLMIMGPSGSGKTTLLSVISGILLYEEGECVVLEKELSSLTEKEKTLFRSKELGFVFQSFNLIPTLTAVENVTIPLLLQKVEKKEALERSLDLLKELGLGDKLYSYPPVLSGGQQQRVSIARGCIHSPKVILCDEPTSYLDHKTGIQVMELLKQIQSTKQTTLIVVTHDPRILEFADRIVTIEDGRIKN